jgi:hypothetical protein
VRKRRKLKLGRCHWGAARRRGFERHGPAACGLRASLRRDTVAAIDRIEAALLRASDQATDVASLLHEIRREAAALPHVMGPMAAEDASYWALALIAQCDDFLLDLDGRGEPAAWQARNRRVELALPRAVRNGVRVSLRSLPRAAHHRLQRLGASTRRGMLRPPRLGGAPRQLPLDRARDTFHRSTGSRSDACSRIATASSSCSRGAGRCSST